MRLIRLLVAGVLLGLLALPAVPAFAQETPPAPTTTVEDAAQEPAPVNPPQPLNGRASYTQNCAACHGQTGQGDGPSASGLGVPPTAFGDYEKMAASSLQAWFDVTKNGRMQQMMPPWKNRLSDQQIWDTVAYAWTLHTSRAEAELGKDVYGENCLSCHGPDGQGAAGANAPDLSDFAATSAVSQAQWAEVVANGKGEMPGFEGKLSAEEQRASLVHLRSLSFDGPLFQEVATGTGVISGTVTNGTTGQPMPDLTVQLGIFDETQQLEQRTATTDEEGFYRFESLATDANLAYAVRTEYPAGVPYSSDIVSFEGEQSALDLPLSVYETTTDGSGIRAERVHYIVEFDAGRALIAELIVLGLDGDRAYVGDGNHVLRFPLPQGVQDLAVNEGELGERFVQIENGFVDRLPLPPGENVRQILFRYSLPLQGEGLDLVRSLPYPATAVNALIADVGQQVSSPNLVDNGKRQTDSGAYFNLSASDLPANEQVRISMTGLSATASSATGGGMGGTTGASTGTGALAGTGTGLNRWVLIGLIALAAGLAAFFVALPLVRRQPGLAAQPGLARQPVSARGGATFGQPAGRDELLDALADLDQAYEAGEIGESAYRDERLRLKALLRDASRKEAQA